MAYNPDTKQYDRYKVGTRLWVKTGVSPEDPKLKGVIVAIQPNSTLGGSLEYYVIKLDRPSHLKMGDKHERPGNDPSIWRTDSSMCEPTHILDDLSDV